MSGTDSDRDQERIGVHQQASARTRRAPAAAPHPAVKSGCASSPRSCLTPDPHQRPRSDPVYDSYVEALKRGPSRPSRCAQKLSERIIPRVETHEWGIVPRPARRWRLLFAKYHPTRACSTTLDAYELNANSIAITVAGLRARTRASFASRRRFDTTPVLQVRDGCRSCRSSA